MLLADFQSFMFQSLFFFFIAGVGLVHLFKKTIGSNDELKSAAKEVATKKAVGFLKQFMK